MAKRYDNLQGREKDSAQQLLSHRVRRMQSSSTPLINVEIIDFILQEGSLPNPAEQANIFILQLGNETQRPEEYMNFDGDEWQSIIGATSLNGVRYVIDHLKSCKLIESSLQGYRLTFPGWDRFEKLQNQTSESRTAFMAMQYEDDELNRIVEELRVGVKEAGFELRVLTDTPKAGLIDDRMRVEIRNSRFLIADITHRNPGAYWEAGFAEGLGKPVIYICKEEVFKEVSHFDTNHHLTVMWDSRDPIKAKEALKNTIRATLPEEARMVD